MQNILRNVFIAFLLVSGSTTLALADGIDFFKGSWEEAQAEAQKTGKPIFVEFYTTWCGPCKMMAKEVFTDEQVGTYYNTHFISMKVDAEKDEPKLVESMGITAVPTLAYFSPEGKLLVRQEGGLGSEAFIEKAKVLVEFDNFEAAYKQNPQDAEAFSSYLTALRVRDEDKAAELATQHLSGLSKTDYLEESNWALIRDFGTDPYGKVFDYMATHPGEMLDTQGEEYLEYVQKGLAQLMDEAVESGEEAPLIAYQKYFFSVVAELEDEPKAKAYYDESTRLTYLKQREEYGAAMVSWDTFLRTYHWDDWETLFQAAMEVSEMPIEPSQMEVAEAWSTQAISLEESALTFMGHAFLLRAMGKEASALDYAQKAKKANEDPRLEGIIGEFLGE